MRDLATIRGNGEITTHVTTRGMLTARSNGLFAYGRKKTIRKDLCLSDRAGCHVQTNFAWAELGDQ